MSGAKRNKLVPASGSLHLKIGGKRRIIREVTTCTAERFEGRYKGFYMEVYRDSDEDEAPRYYMHVYNPEVSFGTACDGWCSEDAETLTAAIIEALEGAQLV